MEYWIDFCAPQGRGRGVLAMFWLSECGGLAEGDSGARLIFVMVQYARRSTSHETFIEAKEEQDNE